MEAGVLSRWWRRGGAVAVALVAGAVDLMLWAGEDTLRWGGTAPGWVVPLGTGLTVAALCVRSRWPRAVFGVQWVWALAGVVMPLVAPFAALVVALREVAARRPRRTSVAAALSCAVPFGVDTVNAGASAPDRFASTAAVAAATWGVLVVAAVAVGRARYNADRRAELLAEIARRNAEDARRDERLRLARDLHDGVAHALSGIVLQAAAARVTRATDTGPVLETIETSGVRAMDELSRMLGLMRTAPPGTDDVPRLVDDAVAAGLKATLVVEGRPVAPAERSGTAVYRVVQEGLTNARKHGGPDGEVEVRCVWSADRVTVCVRSRPIAAGPALPGAGQGLTGLGERVREAGGDLDAGPDGDAFVLRAAVPI